MKKCCEKTLSDFTKELTAGLKEQITIGTWRCKCGHMNCQHTGWKMIVPSGSCLVSGCACDELKRKNPKKKKKY